MIKAILFDLDGTLIQTEVLKAQSYASAIHQLSNQQVSEEQVMQVFGKFVGLSRPEVVKGLGEEFYTPLQKALKTSEKALLEAKIIEERLIIYRNMLADEALLSSHFCPFNLGLLHQVHQDNYTTVVATMSHYAEAKKVLDIMGISEKLDLLLTRDNVSQGKPNPEIYIQAKDTLNVAASECLVIEDSVNGIKAALAAGMTVFAVTNKVTKTSVHSAKVLDSKYIIDNPEELSARIYEHIKTQ